MSAAEQQQQLAEKRLKGRGGGDTPSGMTDDWKADVDRQLVQLHADIRALLYGLIAGCLFLIGGGWAMYNSVMTQVATLQVDVAKTNGKIDLLLERSAPKKQE